MKVDEWTSEDVHTSGGGEFPPCAGLTSNALPEAQSIVSAKSSQTGVSTRNAHIASKPKAQKEADFPHWYALRATYGREKKAYDYLTAKGITAFYPTTNVVKLTPVRDKIAISCMGREPAYLSSHATNRYFIPNWGNPIDVRESRVAEPKRDAKPFNLSDYDILRFNPREKDTQRKHYPYFKERGINMGTQFAFYKHFFLATKRRNEGLSFANLAFPLSLPSKPDSIVGLEERGKPRREDGKAYKGKAEGSNSSEGLWIANLTGKPLKEATNILWFESAYDAMAEYQINPVKSVYVSTGGTPTKGQIKGMLEETRQANHYLGFDKDEAGRGFVKNFKAIAKEMGFADFTVQAFHPLGQYKDWNDALLGKRDQRLIDQGEIDFDYFEFAKAQEAERQQEQAKQEEKEEQTSGFRR